MAKILISSAGLKGILRKDEDVEVSEYLLEDGKYVSKVGKVVGYVRYKQEFSNYTGQDESYWELEIPAWDYPSSNLMLSIKRSE